VRHRLEGVVESGFGLARSSLAPVHRVLCQMSGLSLVEGTLNVRLEQPYIVIPDLALEAAAHGHHETLLLQRCRLQDLPGLIVRTNTQAAGKSHPLEVIEILSVARLRDAWNLRDGDRLVVEVERAL